MSTCRMVRSGIVAVRADSRSGPGRPRSGWRGRPDGRSLLPMGPDERELLRTLLHRERVLTLALVDADGPLAGVMPFLRAPDYAAVYVHASKMARHGRALRPGAAFGAAIHVPDGPGQDPLALPRVTLQGHVEEVGEDEQAALAEAWRETFPTSEMTLGLGDFSFHRLALEGGRLVAGFARAINLGRSSFAELNE